MTKQELVEAIAGRINESKKTIAEIIDAGAEAIIKEVVRGGEVVLIGFGKFKSLPVSERKVRNPRTGEEMIITAHKRPYFSPGKRFKDAVNV